ncbi:DUF2877 domain-containing protein [Pedococcus sp. KACC 23699]|uniref:DUF2877 domain-containing protein n=1 Tax=Pedococcus sp. KACC 23699 TaxID=3149228 RepID=A0AAU7JVZ8_9MICO
MPASDPWTTTPTAEATATATTSYPAAVSERSAKVLARRPRGATVLAVHPLAFYLRIDRSWPDPGLLPVVAAGGLRLPNAVVLASEPPQVGWGVQPGDRVVVGDGEIRLPGATIRRARVWRPVRVPTVDQLPGVRVTGVLERLASSHWVAPARRLATAALRKDPLGDAVGHTVGAGQGLTPSGDDVLCGLLLALRLAGADDAHRCLWSSIRPRLGSTTTVSAALLMEAADGYAVPAVVRLAGALASDRTIEPAEHAGPAEPELVAAAREVRAIGHSSGADLLAGLFGGLAEAQEWRAGGVVLELHTVVPQHFSNTHTGVSP